MLGLGRLHLCQWPCRACFFKQRLQVVRRDCEVQVLPAAEGCDRNADDLAFPIQHGTAAATWRDRSRDLEEAVGTNLPDATYNPLRERAFQSLRISHGVNRLANLDALAVAKREHVSASR